MALSATPGDALAEETRHPLVPHSERAKDALDDLPVINERDDPHFLLTLLTEQERMQYLDQGDGRFYIQGRRDNQGLPGAGIAGRAVFTW